MAAGQAVVATAEAADTAKSDSDLTLVAPWPSMRPARFVDNGLTRDQAGEHDDGGRGEDEARSYGVLVAAAFSDGDSNRSR